ncbi:roadblock/LC7 domain-containing protein [Caldisericum exile]|uniref:roadblock/LC7 domain-containing protein n=1 Tax=Caldisericum exile TaxID=693075 RepID=UPI003C746A30
MDNLENIIKSLGEEINESIFVGITGKDGLPVSMYAKESVESALASAEISSIFSIVERSLKNLSLGKAKEFFVLSEGYGVFGAPLIYDCYLFVIAREPINLGKIRIEFKKYLPKIEEMMK